jgi:hypothetical protein
VLLSLAELPWVMTVGMRLLWNETRALSSAECFAALLPAICAIFVGIFPTFHPQSRPWARLVAILGVLIGTWWVVIAFAN